MIWVSVLIWIAGFAMLIIGIVIFYQAVKADFEPWEQTKRKLFLAGILVAAPVNIWAFHLLPFPQAVVLGLVATSAAVVHNVMIFPKKIRRALGKKK